MRRLDQLLSSLGYCSRREARAWLDAGRVTVAGHVATDPGEKAADTNVRVDAEPLDHPAGLLLLLHKPAGLVCSHDASEGPSVYGLLPVRWRQRNPVVTSVGRLDKDTSGALLLTDQRALVHRLTSPRHKVPKIYRATVDADLQPELIGLFASGTLVLKNESAPCAPAELRILGPREAELTLTEGRYHQVRRMFASQGCEVLTLHRERFGHLGLDGLAAGEWRELPLGEFDKPAGGPTGRGPAGAGSSICSLHSLPLLTGAQKTKLRSLGQTMADAAFLGREGITPAFLAELDRLLAARGLVKLRFTGGQDRHERAALCELLEMQAACECAGTVGRTALFWRAEPAGAKLL